MEWPLWRSATAWSAIALIVFVSPGVCPQPNIPDSGVPETDGPVRALLQHGDTVYVGGSFTTIGGVARNNLAAFDAFTGAVDSAWDPDVKGGPTPGVNALAVQGSRIHVGGSFTTVKGSVPRNNLAAFELADGVNTGVVDAAWDPDITGGFPTVQALVSSGSLIYAAGTFTMVNGATTRNALAAFPPANGVNSGTADPWDPDLWGGIAMDIEIDGGTVYVGGNFTAVNGGAVSREGLAAFDAVTGLADSAWDPSISGVSVSGIFSLLVDGSWLYAGGIFDTVNGSVTRNNLAAFELANGVNTGQVDPVWDPDPSYSWGTAVVQALLAHNSKLFVGGTFDAVNGGAVPRSLAAAFNLADGSSPAVADPWDPVVTDGTGLPSPAAYVSVFIPSGPAGLFVGGDFTKVGGVEHNFLVGFGSTVTGVTCVHGPDLYR